jgi:metal-sulfur cluster biosynthetic enzyme
LIYGVRVVEESEATAGDDSNTDEEDIAGDAVGTCVAIDMTLTYTGCPARKMLTEEVEEEVRSIEGVSEVTLELVWSPNWSLEMVTEQGRTDLREFGLSVPEREEA